MIPYAATIMPTTVTKITICVINCLSNSLHPVTTFVLITTYRICILLKVTLTTYINTKKNKVYGQMQILTLVAF